jgi:hypothetical protein
LLSEPVAGGASIRRSKRSLAGAHPIVSLLYNANILNVGRREVLSFLGWESEVLFEELKTELGKMLVTLSNSVEASERDSLRQQAEKRGAAALG